MNHLDQINNLFKRPNAVTRHYDDLLNLMLLFNECYLNPSVQIGSDSADEMRPIFSAFSEEMPVELEIQTAKMIKVLLRKQSNRSNIGKYGLNAVIKVMFTYTFDFDKFILLACYYMFKINESLINLNILYTKGTCKTKPQENVSCIRNRKCGAKHLLQRRKCQPLH
jgi:hypothetical protein